jgi:hypothetical protein
MNTQTAWPEEFLGQAVFKVIGFEEKRRHPQNAEGSFFIISAMMAAITALITGIITKVKIKV